MKCKSTVLLGKKSVQTHRDMPVFLGYVTRRREYSVQEFWFTQPLQKTWTQWSFKRKSTSIPKQYVSQVNSHHAGCDPSLTHSTLRAVSGVWMPVQLSHRENWHLQKGVLIGPGNEWSWEPADFLHWLPGTELHRTPHPGRSGSLLQLRQTQAGPLWRHRAALSLSRSSHDLKRAQGAERIELTDEEPPSGSIQLLS